MLRDFEIALLGCVIRDNTLFDQIAFLKKEDFVDSFNGYVYEAIGNLIDGDCVADVITIGDLLQQRYQRNLYEDLYKIREVQSVAENISLYANNIRKFALRHKLKRYANKVLTLSADNSIDELDILHQAEQHLQNINNDTTTQIKNVDHLLDELMVEIDRRQNNQDGLLGRSTGFKYLDELTRGFQPGQLIVLAARPGMGKTTLAANIAVNDLLNSGSSVGFFSLEMPPIAIIERIIADKSNIMADRIKSAKLDVNDFKNITEAMDKIAGKNLFILTCESISEIASTCRQIKKQHGLSFVVIDYLQLMLSGKHENAHLVLGEITRTLKKLAIKLGVPIMLLSQMNRAVEGRADKSPMLSDLRQSGSIEQDADIVMFISQEDILINDCRYALLNIAKHRNGERGNIVLRFFGEFNRFTDSALTPQEYFDKINKPTKKPLFI